MDDLIYMIRPLTTQNHTFILNVTVTKPNVLLLSNRGTAWKVAISNTSASRHGTYSVDNSFGRLSRAFTLLRSLLWQELTLYCGS